MNATAAVRHASDELTRTMYGLGRATRAVMDQTAPHGSPSAKSMSGLIDRVTDVRRSLASASDSLYLADIDNDAARAIRELHLGVSGLRDDLIAAADDMADHPVAATQALHSADHLLMELAQRTAAAGQLLG